MKTISKIIILLIVVTIIFIGLIFATRSCGFGEYKCGNQCIPEYSSCCNGFEYSMRDQTCCLNKVYNKTCKGNFCWAISNCGGSCYDSASQSCCDGQVYQGTDWRKCGDSWINISQNECCGNKTYDKSVVCCGGEACPNGWICCNHTCIDPDKYWCVKGYPSFTFK
jgi:hypothetical protein